jgi:hypothetical protein
MWTIGVAAVPVGAENWDTQRQFFVVQDDAWRAALPKRLLISETLEDGGIRHCVSRTVLWDGKLELQSTRSVTDGPADGSQDEQFITYDSGRWFAAISTTRNGWQGKVGHTEPAGLDRTMWRVWQMPNTHESLAETLTNGAIVGFEEHENGDVRLDVATSPEIARCLRDGLVFGRVGWRFVLDRQHNWRPRQLDLVVTRRAVGGGLLGEHVNAPVLDFGGVECCVYDRVVWDDWRRVGSVSVACRMDKRTYVYEGKDWAGTLSIVAEVQEIQVVPPGTTFGVLPPVADFGVVGLCRDDIRGVTERVNAGGAQYEVSKERILDDLAAAPLDTPRRAALRGRAVLAGVMLLGCVVGGALLLYRIRTRGR